MGGDELKKLIAVRAYEFWENDGQRHGRDQLHWLRAEKEVTSDLDKKDDLEGGAENPDQEEQVPDDKPQKK